jgi:DNA-directed RNA polymerase subunit RPC12/RpoP
MIDFKCAGCGVKLEIDDAQAGHKIQCPECKKLQDVPGTKPAPMGFLCNNCGQDMDVNPTQAGKMTRCPHCGVLVLVPSLDGSNAREGCFGLLTFLALVAGAGLSCVFLLLCRL